MASILAFDLSLGKPHGAVFFIWGTAYSFVFMVISLLIYFTYRNKNDGLSKACFISFSTALFTAAAMALWLKYFG
ncbi:MAG: hypothetical protein ACOC4D_00945 [Bacteroidota bacterium]